MADNPEGLSEINALKITDKIKEFVNATHSDIETAASERGEWDARQDIYHNKRYGLRAKKTFPWPGSANFVLPLIDADINRLKPAYVNLAYSVNPIVTFEAYGPEDLEPAKKREVLFDWRMRTQVKMFEPYVLGIDQMLHFGYTIFKIGWKFETRKFTEFFDLDDFDPQIVDALYQEEVTDEVLFGIISEELRPDLSFEENVEAINDAIEKFREGNTKFELTFIETAENRAEVQALNPKDDIVFPTETTNIQKARFIDHRFWLDKNTVKLAMKDGKYEKFDDNDIDSWTGNSVATFNTADHLKSLRDGTQATKSTQNEYSILLHEVATWYDIDGDGIEERVLITYPHNDPTAVLRFIEIPYEHGQFPYVVVRREIHDSTIMSSRGIPQLADDFQTGISTIFNQDIDAGTITNTPTVVSRKNSIKNLRNIRYVPGQVIETENGPADVSILQQGNAAQANRFNNMQYLKGWADERIGNIASAFSSPLNEGGLSTGGKKSATEVDAIAAHETSLQSLDLQIFQQQMAEVYYQIDALYNQFGNDEETILITNEEPVRISRREIQGKFNIVPNGRMDNSNPGLRLKKMILLGNMLAQSQNIKREELDRMIAEEIDPRYAKLLLYSDEEKAQLAQQQSQAIEQQRNKQLQDGIASKRAENMLDVEKEAMLVPIQGKKFAEG